MKSKLLKGYLGFEAGSIVDFGKGVTVLLIQRGIAEEVKDPDGDGREEGGKHGQKKAFSRPPANPPANPKKKGR